MPLSFGWTNTCSEVRCPPGSGSDDLSSEHFELLEVEKSDCNSARKLAAGVDAPDRNLPDPQMQEVADFLSKLAAKLYLL